MNINVIMIGLGNMGKRHLQAVHRVPFCDQIIGYDTDKCSIRLTLEFCDQNDIPRDKVQYANSLDETLGYINERSIVIVAMTAKGKKEIIQSIIAQCPKAIIAEKPLCQTTEEYNELMQLSQESQAPIYVNFPRHMYPSYQTIYESLRGQKILSMHATTWGGMACSGIHILELMTWLINVNSYEFLYVSQPEIFETKREGFYDFAGQIAMNVNGGIIFTLNVLKNKSFETIEITSEEKKYQISQSIKKIMTCDLNGSYTLEDMTIQYVSDITDKVIEDIAHEPMSVKLPTIQDTYHAHKILFDYMESYSLQETNIT